MTVLTWLFVPAAAVYAAPKMSLSAFMSAQNQRIRTFLEFTITDNAFHAQSSFLLIKTNIVQVFKLFEKNK